MTTKIIDIENIQDELEKVNKDLMLINDRLLAVAMDYKSFYDKNFNNNFIYELRDSVMYRLYASSFHFNLLLNHIDNVNEIISHRSDTVTLSAYIDKYKNEITSILDSLVYHSISLFDYLSTLVYFVVTRQTKNIKWSSLAKTVKDKSNKFSSKIVAETILAADISFVDKLYQYRSKIIHDKPDYGNTSLTISIGKLKSSVDANFYAGKILTNSFSDLKKLSVDSKVTVRYASFWIMKRNIETVNNLLFALKTEMEIINKNSTPLFSIVDQSTGKIHPTSYIYWHADKYTDKK